VSDLLRRANRFVGVPYVLHGQTPAPGWDCLGLVRYLRRELFDLPTPPWTMDYGWQEALGAPSAGDLVKTGLPLWDAVPWQPGQLPPPGTALLFRRFGVASHVGLMLDRRHFIHCEQGAGTSAPELSTRWEMRILGAYDHRPDPAASRP
jgi:cell wall-associated NlpC family hydrolase